VCVIVEKSKEVEGNKKPWLSSSKYFHLLEVFKGHIALPERGAIGSKFSLFLRSWIEHVLKDHEEVKFRK
jgi:hypothetical protein